MKLFWLLLLFFSTIRTLPAENYTVLVVAGGHSFDTVAFLNIFEEFEEIGYDFLLQPEANRSFLDMDSSMYDVIVFYDMWEPISDDEKAAYLRLTRSGVPMLFLHHSLVSYQAWPEFEKIIGGRYIQTLKNDTRPKSELSTYRHDVWIDVQIIDPSHPVTSGMQNFRIFDEVYGNYRVGQQVKPLLKTNHPESTPVIAWENKYNQSKIIYIQPGHDKHAYESSEYRMLIRQAIKYLATQKL